MLRYEDLERKFGAAAAYQYLTEIEKAARICSSDVVSYDLQTRLARACAIQDGMQYGLAA